MRELKFRVWSERQKTYDYKHPYNTLGNFYINQNGCLFSDYGNAVTPEIRQKDFIIEQYTGLKDKNGKEIYEGDIIIVGSHGLTPYVVTYRKWDCSFIGENDDREEITHVFNDWPQRYEIIGNIHENPGLLETKNHEENPN